MEIATRIMIATTFDEVDTSRDGVVTADEDVGRWMRITTVLLLAIACAAKKLTTYLSKPRRYSINLSSSPATYLCEEDEFTQSNDSCVGVYLLFRFGTVGSDVGQINEVTSCRARLVLGW